LRFGIGFRAEGLGLLVSYVWFRSWGLGCMVQGLGVSASVWGRGAECRTMSFFCASTFLVSVDSLWLVYGLGFNLQTRSLCSRLAAPPVSWCLFMVHCLWSMVYGLWSMVWGLTSEQVRSLVVRLRLQFLIVCSFVVYVLWFMVWGLTSKQGRSAVVRLHLQFFGVCSWSMIYGFWSKGNLAHKKPPPPLGPP